MASHENNDSVDPFKGRGFLLRDTVRWWLHLIVNLFMLMICFSIIDTVIASGCHHPDIRMPPSVPCLKEADRHAERCSGVYVNMARAMLKTSGMLGSRSQVLIRGCCLFR